MASVQEIMNAANSTTESGIRLGCHILHPEVALLDKKSRKIVHAVSVDENGKYRDHVHIREWGFWWKVELFDMVSTEQTQEVVAVL